RSPSNVQAAAARRCRLDRPRAICRASVRDMRSSLSSPFAMAGFPPFVTVQAGTLLEPNCPLPPKLRHLHLTETLRRDTAAAAPVDPTDLIGVGASTNRLRCIQRAQIGGGRHDALPSEPKRHGLV